MVVSFIGASLEFDVIKRDEILPPLNIDFKILHAP